MPVVVVTSFRLQDESVVKWMMRSESWFQAHAMVLIAMSVLTTGASRMALAEDAPNAPATTAVESRDDGSEADAEEVAQLLPVSKDSSLASGNLAKSITWLIDVVSDVAAIVSGDEIEPTELIDEDNPVILQIVAQCQSVVKNELRFVRLICGDLDPGQRKKIREAAIAALKVYAIQAYKAEAQNGQVFAPGEVTSDEIPDPAFAVRKALLKALPEILSVQQMTEFRDESDKRIAVRKAAVLLNVIAQLDEQLMLDDDQKHKIEQRLSKSWKSNWESWLEVLNSGGQYMPEIPEQCVVPILNPDQKIAWSGISRVNFGFWSGDDGSDADPVEDEWWGFENDPNLIPEGRIQLIKAGGAMIFVDEGPGNEDP